MSGGAGGEAPAAALAPRGPGTVGCGLAAAVRRIGPAESGAWFLVGVPWVAAMAVSRAPAAGWWLGLALGCGVAAREPLLWGLWRWWRGLPAVPTWRAGALFGVAALGAGALWWHSGVPTAAMLCCAAITTVGAADLLARAARPKPAVAGSLAGAVAGGLVCPALLSAAGRLNARAWLLGACLAYTLGVSSCAMHLFLERVPRRSGARSRAAVWLWGWTLGAGALLLTAGLLAGAGPAAGLALCLGVQRAEWARRQPRTTAFRRLGWREALWLGITAALLLWAGA